MNASSSNFWLSYALEEYVNDCFIHCVIPTAYVTPVETDERVREKMVDKDERTLEVCLKTACCAYCDASVAGKMACASFRIIGAKSKDNEYAVRVMVACICMLCHKRRKIRTPEECDSNVTRDMHRRLMNVVGELCAEISTKESLTDTPFLMRLHKKFNDKVLLISRRERMPTALTTLSRQNE